MPRNHENIADWLNYLKLVILTPTRLTSQIVALIAEIREDPRDKRNKTTTFRRGAKGVLYERETKKELRTENSLKYLFTLSWALEQKGGTWSPT